MRLIPLVRFLVRVFWWTYRIEITGLERVESFLSEGKPFIPCYWHGRQFVGVWTMLQLQKKGLKTGFLVSPSRDGELAARLLGSLDVHIMRGSATRTGAEAMRQLMTAIRKEGISPIMTPDGPKGPIYEFKPGTVAVAQLTRTPIVPFAWCAGRGWTFASWDRFELPKPFTKIRVIIGEPVEMPRRLSEDDLHEQCRRLEANLAALQDRAKESLP